MDLWQQLTSSTPGVVTRRAAPAVVGNSSSSTANKKAQDDHPVDDFVLMEFDLAGDICVQVDSALASLKKVTISSIASIIPHHHHHYYYYYAWRYD